MIYAGLISQSNEEEVRVLCKLLKLDIISDSILRLSSSLLNSVNKVRFNKASLDFQISLGVESGELKTFWMKREEGND